MQREGRESRAGKFFLNWCWLPLAPLDLADVYPTLPERSGSFSPRGCLGNFANPTSTIPPLLSISNPSLFQLVFCDFFHTLRYLRVCFWPPSAEASSWAATRTTSRWLSPTLSTWIWSLGNITTLLLWQPLKGQLLPKLQPLVTSSKLSSFRYF